MELLEVTLQSWRSFKPAPLYRGCFAWACSHGGPTEVVELVLLQWLGPGPIEFASLGLLLWRSLACICFCGGCWLGPSHRDRWLRPALLEFAPSLQLKILCTTKHHLNSGTLLSKEDWDVQNQLRYAKICFFPVEIKYVCRHVRIQRGDTHN